MDAIDLKYLEARLGNGDEVTLSRKEFMELTYESESEIEKLKAELDETNNELDELSSDIAQIRNIVN